MGVKIESSTLRMGVQIDRYKTRLAIKHQKHGIDYEMVFAAVVGAESTRLLFTTATALDIESHTIGIETCFWTRSTEEIYMKQPPGY
jgi:hypothetical protein